MQLLTEAIKAKLDATPIYTHDGAKPEDVPVIVKFFDPAGRFTYYVTECEQYQDGNINRMRFFGFCVSPLGKDCDELGYMDFEEIQNAFSNRILPLERDIHFEGTLKDAYESAGYKKHLPISEWN